jgi:hypothetical protein
MYTRPPVSRFRHIFRWDLDKTYLKTDFDTVQDLVRTARLSAEERENIPGSAALIHAIRDAGQRDQPHLIYFISGSPQQLRAVIEKKFALDGFIPDGFVLKPTLRHLLRGRFRAVKSQVGYKLSQLLIGRSEAPIGTSETLFGDDAESDAFIYALYSDLIAGRIPKQTFTDILRVTGCYREQIDEIQQTLEAVVREDPVRRVIIHLDQHTPPLAFVPYFPLVVPIYNHLQTAVVLYLDGTLPASAIRLVTLELLAKYGFDDKRLTNLAEDILRRRRVHFPLEHLERLAAELRALDPIPEEREDPELSERVTDLVRAIADRAEYLRSRPLPDEPPVNTEARDYLELWAQDQNRREEAKRARKLAAKSRAEAEAEAKKEAKRTAKLGDGTG